MHFLQTQACEYFIHVFIIPSLLFFIVHLFLCQLLQDIRASEGQVVVLESRVRGSPPLKVRWYRQGEEILDSPDFRILQKSEISLPAALIFH